MVLFLTKSMFSQNPVWSLPPYYVKFNGGGFSPSQPIPLPMQSGGYQGQLANFSHNAMHDKDGNLLFFIVDNIIYDESGYFIANMQDLAMSGYTNSEILIIPVFDNCNKFIIMMNSYFNTDPNYTVPHPVFTPIYYVLDLSINNGLPSNYGELLLIGNNLNYLNLFPTPSGVPVINNTQRANRFSAVSKIRADGSRFLFLTSGEHLLRYKIIGSTITYDNAWWQLPYAVGDEEIRSEMELIELNNGNYRIAVPYYSNEINPVSNSASSIFIAELSSSGNLLSSSKIDLFSGTSEPYIKGIEFSPNGRYLYFTHLTNNLYSNPIKIYDFNTSSYVTITNSSLLSDINNFSTSWIELGKDGKLYLANSNSLASIGDSDNPLNGLIWDNTTNPINYNENQLNYPSGSYVDWAKGYILPDQIDGMDYSAVNNIDLALTGNTTFCEGDALTFNGSITSGYGHDSYWEITESDEYGVPILNGYSWNSWQAGPPAGSFTFPTLPLGCNKFYKIKLATSNDCNPWSETNKVIKINCRPEVNLSNVTLCSGQNFPVTLSSGYGKGNSFVWTNQGVTVGTSSTLQVNSEGTYCVVVTNNTTGCSSIQSCATVAYDPRMYNTPYFENSLVSCVPSTGKITVTTSMAAFVGYTASPANMLTQFKLYEVIGGGNSYITSQAHNQNLTSVVFGGTLTSGNWFAGLMETSKSYRIQRRIYGTGGCPAWTEYMSDIITCSGRGEVSFKESSNFNTVNGEITNVVIYPNPTTGNFTANVEQFTAGDLIQVLDYSGKVVLEKNINTNKIDLNIAEMANGLYFVKVISAHGISMEKLIKN